MIIEGGSRSNGYALASHLRKPENERVAILEFRHCFFDTLPSALKEMEEQAILTKCTKPLYHAHIDWRANEQLTREQQLHAVDVLEEKLGFTGQPRVVVQHVKHGREHVHIVWSRIDLEHNRALSDSHNYRKHEQAARQLEKEFAHARVQGVHVERNGQERPERGFEKWQFEQAKQSQGPDPRDFRQFVREAYERSDNGATLQTALQEQGYVLAKADRRDGFLVVDCSGDYLALNTKTVSARAAAIRSKLSDLDRTALPTLADAQEQQRQHAAQRAMSADARAAHEITQDVIRSADSPSSQPSQDNAPAADGMRPPPALEIAPVLVPPLAPAVEPRADDMTVSMSVAGSPDPEPQRAVDARTGGRFHGALMTASEVVRATAAVAGRILGAALETGTQRLAGAFDRWVGSPSAHEQGEIKERDIGAGTMAAAEKERAVARDVRQAEAIQQRQNRLQEDYSRFGGVFDRPDELETRRQREDDRRRVTEADRQRQTRDQEDFSRFGTRFDRPDEPEADRTRQNDPGRTRER